MEIEKTWRQYLLLTIVTVPLAIALVVAMFRQFKYRYGGKRGRRRW